LPISRPTSSCGRGDLIFTGTPEGVGGVQAGQTMTGGIDGLGELVCQGDLKRGTR
jgi:2-keto-4-pentenoate hydratase/2-oxohepta-3-ene-1,7-dioic acid hydratase in catechol pathway